VVAPTYTIVNQKSRHTINMIDSPTASITGSNDNNDFLSSEENRIDEPLENDVLCGRGGSINSHKGNEQFRTLVEKRKRVYLTARFKREKRLIASSIVSEIRGMDPPGRFLARKGHKDDSYWYDIGDEKARDKTSQALRENAPSIRAEIETEIHQQREEMRRQEESLTPQQRAAAAAAALPQSSQPFPPPLHGVHGAPAPPQPLPPHGQHSYASYAQQYYDYYYHYYGYGAPPPPPPPGYPGGPSPSAGYAHPPPPLPPYWAAQPSQQQKNDRKGKDKPKPDNAATAYAIAPQPTPPNQEEEDRRIAMALQQEENVRAFEDRNRRYGSDRKASRSAAFCAPGYRPRLLNDRALDDSSQAPGGSSSRKRPAMSLSHLVSSTKTNRSKPAPLSSIITMQAASAAAPMPGQTMATEHLTQEELDHRMAMLLQAQEDKAFHNHLVEAENGSRKSSRSNAHPKFERNTHQSFGLDSMMSSNLMSWSRRAQIAPAPGDVHKKHGSMNSDSNFDHDHHGAIIGMDLKPAAINSPFSKLLSDGIDRQHSQDHSLGTLPSVCSKGRAVHFKEDSDIMSLFGEGSTIIPLPLSHGSQRVRDDSIGSFNPIALDSSQNSTSSRLSQFQRKSAPIQHTTTPQRVQHPQEQQDSSLLYQVAHQIFSTFGSSWPNSSETTTTTGCDTMKNKDHHPAQRNYNMNEMSGHRQHDMETEMGQEEVLMDVRDESNLPSPHPIVADNQIDWPSRAGCHSWIPESIGASASAFFGSYNEDLENRLTHHDHDHSLTRDHSYSKADISPVNSLDMDLSQSSLTGVRRRGKSHSLLMDVFDHSNADSIADDDLLPHFHQSVLQHVPSWERSCRSRSPTLSFGDMGADEEDDSLIRVNSYDVKEGLPRQDSRSSTQLMPPPARVANSYHVTSSHQQRHELDDSDDVDMGIDWEDHAGE
jgi:hypothetical protein